MQSLWAQANHRAAQALVTVIDGGKGPVKVQGGVVTLDLASVVEAIAQQLGLPAGIGAKLPPSIAHVQILKSDQIGLVQDIGRALRSLALWLSIAVPLLFALAIWLARGWRRRAVMNVGFGLAIAGLLVLLARALVQSRVPASLVADASIRPAAAATVSIATSMLAEIAGELVLVGALTIIAAWLAGPAGVAVGFRRTLAPYVRDLFRPRRRSGDRRDRAAPGLASDRRAGHTDRRAGVCGARARSGRCSSAGRPSPSSQTRGRRCDRRPA